MIRNSILEEIKEKESSFMSKFLYMPTVLELDVESYAQLVDELGVDPMEDFLLFESYELLVNDYGEKRIRFCLTEDVR